MSASANYKEIRFVGLGTDTIHCYVLCAGRNYYLPGLEGWHHKEFPKTKTILAILQSFRINDPCLWPNESPDEPRRSA
jgi:hypothetical protein